jgi:CRP-like cAMP-binding protein
MLFLKFTYLNKGEYIYKAGDTGKYFYFVMTGKLEILVKPAGAVGEENYKFSKQIDETEFFGLKDNFNETRSNNARSLTACEIISFDAKIYREIIMFTQLSGTQKKIQFLNRFVPKLRTHPR